MSAPVDVLAVLERLEREAAAWSQRYPRDAKLTREAAEAIEARAAVAELIEAVGTYEEAVRLFGRTTPSAIRAYAQLLAALARVQGGAK